jgi:hypothetical protein
MTSPFIQTYTKRKFYVLDPKPEQVSIEDIAHALSMVCRFTGHVSRFYSVAEHSVRVSRRVMELTGDPRQSLWGLLHDASEAYIADVSRPLKHTDAMSQYRAAEVQVQDAILERFGLSVIPPYAVHTADLELLATEARDLMSPLVDGWMELPPALVHHKGLGWTPEDAEAHFLYRFQVLTLAMRHGMRLAPVAR